MAAPLRVAVPVITRNYEMSATQEQPLVGILTIPHYHNFGTQLQAWALQEAVQRLGYRAEVINYGKTYLDDASPLRRALRAVLRPARTLRALAGRSATRRWEGLIAPRARNTDRFISQHLRLGPERLTAEEQLASLAGRFDAVVVGSDQIWNPLGHLGEQAYFATFVAPERRIAYAPSVGVSSVTAEGGEWLARGAGPFRFLSVRERSGAAVLRELTGRDAAVVVDPTLLHSTEVWREFAGESSASSAPYALCYFLQGDRYARDAAKRIAVERGLALKVLPFHPVDAEDDEMRANLVVDSGPLEFLRLVSGASVMLTDSFHGCVFATQFRRPFLAFRRYEHRLESTNFGRIENLLEQVGLEGQIAARDHVPQLTELDFDAAHRRLQQWRQSSWDYLRTALATVTQERG